MFLLFVVSPKELPLGTSNFSYRDLWTVWHVKKVGTTFSRHKSHSQNHILQALFHNDGTQPHPMPTNHASSHHQIVGSNGQLGRLIQPSLLACVPWVLDDFIYAATPSSKIAPIWIAIHQIQDLQQWYRSPWPSLSRGGLRRRRTGYLGWWTREEGSLTISYLPIKEEAEFTKWVEVITITQKQFWW